MQNCCVQTSSSVSCTGGGGWEICLGRCRGRSKENAPGQRHKHAEGLPRNYTGPRNLRLTDRHTMHMAACPSAQAIFALLKMSRLKYIYMFTQILKYVFYFSPLSFLCYFIFLHLCHSPSTSTFFSSLIPSCHGHTTFRRALNLS